MTTKQAKFLMKEEGKLPCACCLSWRQGFFIRDVKECLGIFFKSKGLDLECSLAGTCHVYHQQRRSGSCGTWILTLARRSGTILLSSDPDVKVALKALQGKARSHRGLAIEVSVVRPHIPNRSVIRTTGYLPLVSDKQFSSHVFLMGATLFI